MRTLGFIILTVGVIWFLVYFGMDTSLPTASGMRVNNNGLIADKQNNILISVFLILSGLLCILLRKCSDEGAVKCPYCAEPIKPEAIKCKHCGSKVVRRRFIRKATVESKFDEAFNPSELTEMVENHIHSQISDSRPKILTKKRIDILMVVILTIYFLAVAIKFFTKN